VIARFPTAFTIFVTSKEAASTEEAAFLKQHEGAITVGLETDTAKRALALLQARGIAAKIATTAGADCVEPGVKGGAHEPSRP